MITLTEAAVSQVKKMMEEEGEEGLLLRVGVTGGGCTGLSYKLGFDTDKNEDDTEVNIDGITVVIDKESAPILEGLVIDYKQNMMGGGFILNNPNAIATCGCGASFRTATRAGTPEKC